MRAILAQIHYMPDSWKGNAHTYKVRDEFTQLYQYKVVSDDCMVPDTSARIPCVKCTMHLYCACLCMTGVRRERVSTLLDDLFALFSI